MLKAITLDVRLWIEGEDEPAHDFAQSTIDAVKTMLETAAANNRTLKITIRSIKERS
jgi:hypothetical protein